MLIAASSNAKICGTQEELIDARRGRWKEGTACGEVAPSAAQGHRIDMGDIWEIAAIIIHGVVLYRMVS